MFASHDVITTRNLSARLLDDIIWVAFIATADIRRCAWPLIRAMLFRHEAGDDGANDDERAEAEDDGFFSLTHDEEGITLIMDSACRAAFDEFCDGNTITYAPCTWRAFQIHLGTSATPGVVCMLSSLLADAHVSILNVSTYDSDFILVQEADVTRAADMIRESLESGLARMGARPLLSPTVPTDDSALSERETISLDDADGGETSGTHVGSSGADSVDTLGDSRPASAAERAPLRQREGGAAWAAHGAAPSSAAGGTAAEAGAEAASGAKQPSVAFAGCKPSAFDAKRRELYLKVLEPTLTVTRLSERALHDVSSALLRLLLVRTSERDHFWSYACVTDGPGDVSLVMDEGAAELFADGAITGTCGAWRAVRLCGHRFGFDETGVVSTMLSSVYARNIPTMCLSTFATSITIVEDASLEEALDSFRAIVPRVVWAGAEDAERAAQALSIR